MEQLLTVEQITQQYVGEWVLLADPEINQSGQIVSGRVVAHSKDRDEVYRRDTELRLELAATLYTGKLAEDSAIIL